MGSWGALLLTIHPDVVALPTTFNIVDFSIRISYETHIEFITRTYLNYL